MRVTKDLIPHIDEMPSRQRECHPEIKDEVFWSFYEKSKDFSMIHVTGFYNVYQSMRYIHDRSVRGCLIECGCFLGGMAIFMGLLRSHLQMQCNIVLFDTFEGPPVGEEGISHSLPDYFEAVKANIATVLGGHDRIELVRGAVEDTVPKFRAQPIALLRLDTDYYSSTKVEFEHLYPQLQEDGIVIIDDYGLFEGSRKATDEYFAARPTQRPLLNRIDCGIWAGIKPLAAKTQRKSWWTLSGR